MDVSTKQILYSHQPYQSLTPASTLKIATIGAGLGILGDEYQFQTTFQYSGNITNGILQGDIYINGGGDPTSASGLAGADNFTQYFDKIAKSIQEKGIKSIDGNIFALPGKFDSDFANGHWIWKDIGNYYGCSPASLNLNQNIYNISFQLQPVVGKPLKITNIEPKLDLKVISEVTSAGANSGDNAYIHGGTFSETQVVRGTLPVGSGIYTIKGANPDPEKYYVKTLKSELTKRGILIREKNYENLKNTPYASLFTLYSPKLKEITKLVGFESNNFLAESIVKAIALKNCGKGGFENGLEAIISFYEEKGISLKKAIIKDGSGLSPLDKISSLDMCKILAEIAKNQSVLSSIPIVGKEGTVKTLLAKSPTLGKIRAKSGTLEYVRCYVGYADAYSGKKLCFALFVNNFDTTSGTIRNELGKIMEAIVYQ